MCLVAELRFWLQGKEAMLYLGCGGTSKSVLLPLQPPWAHLALGRPPAAPVPGLPTTLSSRQTGPGRSGPVLLCSTTVTCGQTVVWVKGELFCRTGSPEMPSSWFTD